MKSMWDINPVLVTGHSENYGFNSVVTLGLTVTFSLLSIITLNFWTCGTFKTFPSTLTGLLSLPPIPAHAQLQKGMARIDDILKILQRS